MGAIYWNTERPEPFVLDVDFAAGVAGVLDTTLDGEVPRMVLPAAGGDIDAVCRNGGVADELADFNTELEKYTPVKAAAAFGVGVELAVNASGLFLTATTGQRVVAKSVQAATVVGQVVTARRIASYPLGGE